MTNSLDCGLMTFCDLRRALPQIPYKRDIFSPDGFFSPLVTKFALVSTENLPVISMTQLPLKSNDWDKKSSEEKYDAMGSWFVGPKGENGDMLKKHLDQIVEQVVAGRREYFPGDLVRHTRLLTPLR